MRGKKAKVLRKVIKRQILKMSVDSKKNLMEKHYEPVQKFAKQQLILIEGKQEKVTLIYTQPIKLDFCFRRAYQSLKSVVKAGKVKNVK